MYSVYDLSLLWTGLPNDPQLRSYNPTLGEPTSAGFSNLSYLANASASAVTPKVKQFAHLYLLLHYNQKLNRAIKTKESKNLVLTFISTEVPYCAKQEIT